MPLTNHTSHPAVELPRTFEPLPKPQRIGEHDWPAGTLPLVSILCLTYNHERFIAECLDGFLMQETTFPVEIVIHDDASTDRTTEIVRAYHARFPRLIHPIIQKQNLFRNGGDLWFIFKMAGGEYIALCEGDDSWSDPQKLQRQANFLDANADCALCHHRVSYLHEESRLVVKEFPPGDRRIQRCSVDLLAQENFIQTCSLMVRNALVPPVDNGLRKLKLGDWPLCVLVGQRGALGYIDQNMATYRIHGNGYWSSASRAFKIQAVEEMVLYLATKLSAKALYPWSQQLCEIQLRRFLDALRNARVRQSLTIARELTWLAFRVSPRSLITVMFEHFKDRIRTTRLGGFLIKLYRKARPTKRSGPPSNQ